MKVTNLQLEAYLQQLLQDNYPKFLASPEEPPAIRVNTLKIDVAGFENKLKKWGVAYQPHPANPIGFILEQDKLPLSHTLSFFTGEFFYQGIASQLPVLALDPQPGETVLDMAASPGSKSTQIAAMMNNIGRLIVNDPSLSRLRALGTNLLRAGVINDVMMRVPGQQMGQLFPEFFDRVLVDAPCTALGTFASHRDEIQHWWSLQKLKKMANIQHQLLVSALKAVKVGGIVVYSTCSIAPEENEQLIDEILRRYPVRVVSIPHWTGIDSGPGIREYKDRVFHRDLDRAIRTLPGTRPIEGFFIVKLQKLASIGSVSRDKRMEFQPIKSAEDDEIASLIHHLHLSWGIDPDFLARYRFVLGKKRLWLVHPQWEHLPARDMVKAGLKLAEKRFPGWKLEK